MAVFMCAVTNENERGLVGLQLQFNVYFRLFLLSPLPTSFALHLALPYASTHAPLIIIRTTQTKKERQAHTFHLFILCGAERALAPS